MIYLKRGRRDLVVRALSYGADPNHNITALFDGREIYISTPLECAIASKTLGIVRLILEHGADPAQVTNNSHDDVDTPLECAVSAGNLAVVRLLVDEYGIQLAGAFPPEQVVPHANIPTCVPLVIAIRKNRLSMVRYFIETKGVRVNFPHSDRFEWSEERGSWAAKDDNVGGVDVEVDLQSYLHHAVPDRWEPGNPGPISKEMVTFLLDAGAVMNYAGEDSDNPLLNAVEKRRGDIVELLLARGAEPHAISRMNSATTIIIAAMNNDISMAVRLLAANASVAGNIHIEELDSFANLMEEDVTALHLFAKWGNAEGVALMVKAGAEVDAEAFSGLTPLLEAAKSVGKSPSAERIEAACACCRLLVEAGADIHHMGFLADDFYDFEDEDELNELDDSGFSALTYAVDRNVPALAECLIELGANFTQCTAQRFSLLMHAALDGKFEVLAVLLAVSESLPPAEGGLS